MPFALQSVALKRVMWRDYGQRPDMTFADLLLALQLSDIEQQRADYERRVYESQVKSRRNG